MKRNYFNSTKTGLKALMAGLFLFGSLATKAQCTASLTYTQGANGAVAFSSTSSGTTISTAYFWNFGPGGSGSGISTSHTYTSNGYKTVCLTIISNTTSPTSCTSTVCDSLWVSSVGASTTTPCNASFSYSVGPNGSVSFVSMSTNTTSTTNYSWNFGSAIGYGPSTSHTYATNGMKSVCLTITDNVTGCFNTYCDSILITNIAPTGTPCAANFNYSIGPNGAVSFVSTSTGTSSGTTYSWSFSGTPGSGAAPTHTFGSNGLKWICLTMMNPATNCTNTACDSLWITNTTGSTTPCNPSVMYTLGKDSTMALTWFAYPSYPSNVTNATWYWGDGSSTMGLYPNHTYSAAGTYSTCVTISVSCGTITATYCYVAAIFRANENNEMIQLNVVPSGETGIKHLARPEAQLNVYPNPSNGEFVIELNGNGSKESTVYIYNMIGEKVFEKNVSTSGQQTIDASSLSSGTYLIKVDSGSGSLHKKVTIQK